MNNHKFNQIKICVLLATTISMGRACKMIKLQSLVGWGGGVSVTFHLGAPMCSHSDSINWRLPLHRLRTFFPVPYAHARDLCCLPNFLTYLLSTIYIFYLHEFLSSRAFQVFHVLSDWHVQSQHENLQVDAWLHPTREWMGWGGCQVA